MSNAARYLPAIVWVGLLAYVLTRHVKVYRLYDSQLRVVQAIERDGGIETGSTLVAINQRVRYIIRIVLAIFGILIGVGGLYGVYRPGFGQSVAFGISVLTYLYASEAATGYLTIRDKRVIDKLLEIDAVTQTKSMDANTAAMDRNTAAMTRTSDADDLRDIRDAATLKANTDATDSNTHAVHKNTQARDGEA